MGRSELNKLTWDVFWDTFRGNPFSWKVVAVVYVWAYLSLIIPSAQTKGPVTDFGQVPVYQDNGVLFFCSSVVAYSLYHFVVDPGVSEKIYENFPYILGGLNTSALVFCAVLLVKGRYFPDFKEKVASKRFPIAYEFYAGKELHPRLLGVDVKQFTVCRIGMIT
jgi:7-dehydrocholesterol reductase